MALPSAIATQMANSAERSRYSETKEVWREDSGTAGEENPGRAQTTQFVQNAALGYGVYKFAPSLTQNAHSLLRSQSVQSWGLRGDAQIDTVGDVLKLSTGKSALKTLRAVLFNNALENTNLDYSDTANFWYSGLKKIEERGTGLGLPIFDDVLAMFTRATYFSDILSYSTKKKGKTVLNVSMNVLGATNRDRTLNLYANQLGIDRKYLNLVQHLVFENGNVYEGILDTYGNVNVAKGNIPLNKVEARLVDKGKHTESLLGIIDETLGLKNPHTGGTFAEGIGGNEGHILLSAKEIDPRISKTFGSVFDTLNIFKLFSGRESSVDQNPLVKRLVGKVGGDTAAGRAKLSNAVLHTESYTSMALQRTSGLINEMFNEAGSFFEYFSPSAKSSLFSSLYKQGLTPRIQHGHAGAMLFRYSKLASTVGAGLMAINQLGYSMQHGSGVEKTVSGGLQAVALTLVGAFLGKKIKGVKGTLPGALLGGSLGLLGAAGIGPFASGTIPGFANVAARANEIRSYAGEYTGMNWLRRKSEEIMPGSTSATAALGVGFVAGTAYVTASRFLNRNTVVEHAQRQRFLLQTFGQDPSISLRQISKTLSERHQNITMLDREFKESSKSLQGDALKEAKEGHARQLASTRGVNYEGLSEEQIRRVEKETLNYVSSLEQAGEHGILSNPLGKTNDLASFDNLANRLTEFKYAQEKDEILKHEKSILGRFKRAIDAAPRGRAVAYASVVGAVGWSLLTGGLGTSERPDELRALNQGRKLEAVRRNQKWEMGQGGYEGDDILYYRPTLTARLSSGAVQAGSSGGRGPVEEFLLKNFTYELERENYWTRPAPITGAAFDQVPFIYPLIQPLTDMIKSPKLMHVPEWTNKNSSGNQVYLERSTGLDEIPEEKLGGIALPAPVSPYSPGRVFGKAWTETTSLSGLVGFYAKTAKNFLTGTPDIADQRQELESFSRNMDIDSKFYDLQGGGSFLNVPFTSEIIRRFVHKDEVKQYNPIENSMPSWMPETSRYGNPYTSTRYGEGEYRVPGSGYEALHPELKGMDPENYPLLHRLNILGDVAPYSSQYDQTFRESNLMEYEGSMSSEERGTFYRHKQGMKQKREKRPYDSYMFKPSSYDFLQGDVQSVDPESMTFTIGGYGGRFGISGISNDMGALISEFNLSVKEAAELRKQNQDAFLGEIKVGASVSLTVPASIGQAVDEAGIIRAGVTNNGFNVNKEIRSEGDFASSKDAMSNWAMTNYAEKIIGGAWEATTHFLNKMAQPIEHIGMFGAAPINKLLPFRDALEDYEAREVYGTEMKGWDDPIGGWIAPGIRTALHNYLGLDFESPGLARKRETEEYFDKLKYLKYNELSRVAEESKDAMLARQYRAMADKTVIGSDGYVNRRQLGKVLGGREAMFASGFAREYNPSRQQDIIDALPGYKQEAMRNFYLSEDLNAINRAASAGPMSTYGMDYAADLIQKKEEAGSEETTARKNAEINDFFQYKTVPKVDWIGFNPAVDLEDVKLKYIQSEGMDYHDFGIYPTRSSYMPRKPYIDEEAVQGLNRLTFKSARNAFAEVNAAYGATSMNSYNIQGAERFQDDISLEFDLTALINPFEGE